MAFPTHENTEKFQRSANGTSTSVSQPAGLTSDQRVIVLMALDDNDTAGTTSQAGWNREYFSSASDRLLVFHGLASEVEWPLVVSHDSESTAGGVLVLGGAGVPLFSSGATGSGAQPNPPSFTPAGGAKDYLWIAVYQEEDGAPLATGAPSGFTGLDTNSSSGSNTTGATSLGWAFKAENTATQDPGAFSGAATDDWVAITIAVPPGATGPVLADAAVSGSGTLSSAVSPGIAQTSPNTGSGTLTPSGKPGVAQNAGVSGSGTLSTTRVPKMVQTANESGSGTLGGSGNPAHTRNTALTGSGTLSAVGFLGATPQLIGDGVLSAVGIPNVSTSANLNGSGTLSSSRKPGVTQPGVLNGGGTLSATGVLSFSTTAVLNGSGTLAAIATVGRVVPLGGSGVLTPAVKVGFSRTPAVSGSGTLSATGIAQPARTVPLTGSGSLSAFGIPFIPTPVVETAKTGIELEIYKFSDYNTKAGILPYRLAPTGLNEMKGVGGGSFNVLRNDPKVIADPGLLKGRNICKIMIDRRVVGAFLLGDRQSTIVSQGERAELTYSLAGAGLKQFFDDARVEAWGGTKQSSRSARNFNFSSEVGDWYNAGSWVDPILFSTVGSQAHYPTPAKWPEGGKDAGWIWGSPFLNPGPMPFGKVYFRYTLNIAADGRYAIYTAVDDVFQLYVDGEQIAKSAESSTSWREASRVEVDLTAGTHIIGYSANNLQAVGYNGPAALACAIFQINGLESETLVGGSQVSGWKVMAYPTSPPGWTPGEILGDLMAEAQARGVIFPTLFTKTFSSTVDSYGVPWPASLKTEWSFTIGESLLSVITKLEEASVDIWIDPSDMTLNMAPSRGVDRTIFQFSGSTAISTPVEFKLGKHLRTAKTQSKSKIKNDLLLKTVEGWLKASDSTSVGYYGRLESSLDTNANSVLAAKLAQIVFAQRAQEEEGASYDLIFPEYVPFVDFNIGDWVLAPNEQGVSVKRRVMSISFEEGEAGEVLYTIEFDTIFKDNEDRLNRIVDKLGGSGPGGSLANAQGSTPGVGDPIVIPPPATPQVLVPKAPTGLAVTSTGLWTPDGVTPISTAVLTWNPVTQAIDNSALTPQYYEIRGNLNGSTSIMDFGTSTTNSVSLTPFNPTSNWVFQVRAVSADGVPSDWSAVATHVMSSPPAALVAPDAPNLTSSRGTLTVNWSGLLGGMTPPPEFRYVYAQVSSTVNTGPYQRMGPMMMRETRSIPIPNLTVGQQYWVQLVGVDGSGLTSPASIAVSHTIQGIVGTDIVASSVNANILIAGSVQTNHLSPEVGNELNIAGNVTIAAVSSEAAAAQAAADGTQENLDVMQQYYSFGPTGAIVSKPGSVFATRIDNDSIDMLENGNVISYWNSGTLYVNQLVGAKVTLGNHQLEQYGSDDTIVRAL